MIFIEYYNIIRFFLAKIICQIENFVENIAFRRFVGNGFIIQTDKVNIIY